MVCSTSIGEMLMTKVSVTNEVRCRGVRAASVLLERGGGGGGGDGLVLKLRYINGYTSKSNYFLYLAYSINILLDLVR